MFESRGSDFTDRDLEAVDPVNTGRSISTEKIEIQFEADVKIHPNFRDTRVSENERFHLYVSGNLSHAYKWITNIKYVQTN